MGAKLKAKLDALRAVEKHQHDVFLMNENHPAANHYFGLYMQRSETARAEIAAIQAAGPIPAQVEAELMRIGATDEAMSVLASSVLQLAKQVLSFRFGPKRPCLPGARAIGGQTIVEIIWEGRNHVLHWEEGNPHQKVKDMVSELEAHLGGQIDLSKNNAVLIVDACGWKSASDVANDLRVIVS